MLQWLVMLALLLVHVAVVMMMVGGSSVPPAAEMSALEDLYNSTGGNRGYWIWYPDLGSRWDFSVNISSGEYLSSPCGSGSGSGNDAWQGVTCESDMGTIVALDLSHFNLTGSVPSSVSNIRNLTLLTLWNNDVTGTIPSSLVQLTKLLVLDFEDCSLTGPFPSFLTKLINLQQIWLSYNSLTGYLPSELGDLSNLGFFNLAGNFISGSIPASVSGLANLVLIGLDYNIMTGTIPSGFGELQHLEILGISNMDLSGTIPFELGSISSLQYFYVQSNRLTGTLFPEIGELMQVEFFYVSNNMLSGTIPREIGHMIQLKSLYADSNVLSGTIPVQLHNCSLLQIIRFQRNRLSGRLSGIFQNLPFLENVDFSDNRFSGSIPSDVFELPRLQSIVFTKNCFYGELPASVCSPRNVTVMSLDGLGAARHCKHAVIMPFTGVTLDNTMSGTIPECLFKLPNLQVLHLTGNGLSGSIADVVPANSGLLSLSISHNKLTGTIPTSIQGRSFVQLDMSFNKFTGTYDHRNEFVGKDSSLVLEVNRLSGWFPTSQSNASGELKALRGNIFGCKNVPQDDVYSEDFNCGSENLEFTLLTFALSLGLTSLFCGIIFLIMRKGSLIPRFVSDLVFLFKHAQVYISYLESMAATSTDSMLFEKVRRVATFSDDLGTMSRLFLVLLGLSVVTCLPIYAIKFTEFGVDDNYYTTHSYQYHWTLSIAYIKGSVPAVLLILMWMSMISAMLVLLIPEGPLCWLVKISSRPNNSNTQNLNGEVDVVKLSNSSSSWFTYAFIFLVNAFVTGSVNGAYIYYSTQALSPGIQTSIQMAVAVFKVVWSMIVIPVLAKPMKVPGKVVGIELILSVFNNILIPCLVAAFTSPACFQGLLFLPDEVESKYSYTFCQTSNFQGVVDVCVEVSTRIVYVSPLRPPFLYNNLCTSTILTKYIPVYVFVYAIQLLVSVLQVIVLTSVDYGRIPRLLHRGLHGVFWPGHVWNANIIVPRDILKATEIISFDILNHLAVFTTFGLSSPYLAFILILSVWLKLRVWRVMISRFVYTRLSQSREVLSHYELGGRGEGVRGINNDDDGLFILNLACLPIVEMLENCMRPIVLSSAVFFAFICWDMAGDEIGWREAFWAPVVILIFPVLLWCGLWYRRQYVGKTSDLEGDKLDFGGHFSSAVNPIQNKPDIEMKYPPTSNIVSK